MTHEHIVTEAEREFYKAFVTILEHLINRAHRAEAEVSRLNEELTVRREQVEYFASELAEVRRKEAGG